MISTLALLVLAPWQNASDNLRSPVVPPLIELLPFPAANERRFSTSSQSWASNLLAPVGLLVGLAKRKEDGLPKFPPFKKGRNVIPDER